MNSSAFFLLSLYVVLLLNSSNARSLNDAQGNENFSRRNQENQFFREPGTVGESHDKKKVNLKVIVDSPFSANAKIRIVEDSNTQISTATSSTPLLSRLSGNYTSRSERKCQEYCDSVFNVRPVLPLVGAANETWENSSSIRRNSSVFHIKLVVGGKRAVSHFYPHVVALGRHNEENVFILMCGGTLVSQKWVLTAAHCTHGNLGGASIARLGIDNLSETDGEVVAIKRTVRHSSYRPPAMYADIALLELAKSVTFSSAIMPACLHQQYHVIPNSAWVCGWGATEYGGNESDTLQVAQLDLVDNVNCALKHTHSISVPDGVVPSMICAGAPRSSWQRDTCHGDSGGPLQITHISNPCVHQVIGITSFGAGCAFADSPGVYTRVSHYLDWIENIVWPERS